MALIQRSAYIRVNLAPGQCHRPYLEHLSCRIPSPRITVFYVNRHVAFDNFQENFLSPTATRHSLQPNLVCPTGCSVYLLLASDYPVPCVYLNFTKSRVNWPFYSYCACILNRYLPNEIQWIVLWYPDISFAMENVIVLRINTNFQKMAFSIKIDGCSCNTYSFLYYFK